jgi:hypothetical protein
MASPSRKTVHADSKLAQNRQDVDVDVTASVAIFVPTWAVITMSPSSGHGLVI